MGCDNVYKSYSHPQSVPMGHTSSDPMVNTQVPSFEAEYNLE